MQPCTLAVLRVMNKVPNDGMHILGLILGIEHATIERLRQNNMNNEFLMQIVITWLNTGKATWKIFIEALKNKLIGLQSLANNAISIAYSNSNN